MNKYHKINGIWKRDPNNPKVILRGQYSIPEFGYLADNIWRFTEKVDGTNIRIIWQNGEVSFRGKTDAASIPGRLVDYLKAKFTKESLSIYEHDLCLYGEGYGAKIQKGGGNYRLDNSFVLFDVKVDQWWLREDDINDVAHKLNIDIVPVVCTGTLHDGIAFVENGLRSRWGDFKAEGIVGVPIADLHTRSGERIIVKIKNRDFQ